MQRLLLLLITAAALCGCARPTAMTSAPAVPLTVRLAVNDIYCTKTACSCIHDVAQRNYAETQRRLQEQFGIDLQLDYYEEPYDLEKMILSGAYDGVICKPWTAMMLAGQAGAEFDRVADICDPNNTPWLTGIVVVMADSPIRELAALSGKRIVIGQPDAYEKHQAAKRLFSQRHLDFAEVEQTASCIENLGKLMDGVVDAAVVSDYALSAGCAVDFASPDDFRILGATERIPLTSVMLNARKVSDADRDRLRAALLALCAEGEPEGMISKGFLKAAVWAPVELEASR